jgi:hypothetical protein
MKKSFRLALAAAVVMSIGTCPAFATMGGGDPHPQSTSGTALHSQTMGGGDPHPQTMGGGDPHPQSSSSTQAAVHALASVLRF